MRSEYDTYTKNKVKVSYLLYAMLFELGLILPIKEQFT